MSTTTVTPNGEEFTCENGDFMVGADKKLYKLKPTYTKNKQIWIEVTKHLRVASGWTPSGPVKEKGGPDVCPKCGVDFEGYPRDFRRGHVMVCEGREARFGGYSEQGEMYFILCGGVA